MKVKKRLLGLLLAVVMLAGILPVAASAGWHDSTHIAYEVTDGNIYFDKATGTIVDCDESVTTANIPEAIDGTPVTSIGSGAFEDCISLTSVEIPSNVTRLSLFPQEAVRRHRRRSAEHPVSAAGSRCPAARTATEYRLLSCGS